MVLEVTLRLLSQVVLRIVYLKTHCFIPISVFSIKTDSMISAIIVLGQASGYALIPA